MPLPSADLTALMQAAVAARAGAYAPYSNYPVGAAVLCADGEIVTGCNIENASFGLSMCAERVALFAARARGKRIVDAICIAGPNEERTAPCGACRQVIHEFNPRMLVCYSAPEGAQTALADELLPGAFELTPDAAGHAP